MTRPVASIALLAALALGSHARAAAREYGGHYTADKLANARANCAQFDWAKKIRTDAVAQAKPWLDLSDDDLWAMVPGQDLPRTIDVTMDTKAKGPERLACLKCGEKINAFGNYPYEPDFDKKPWKLTCPSCGVVFPTNDFAKYYASGIDEHGLFNPKKADRSLLYNTDHPDPKDPLHTYGVDDGFGFVDPATGRAHKFVAYYTWKYWRHLYDGLTALANAYVYTGDPHYAHKAAVLLDRIADVYPDMDWKPYADRGWYHSDGGMGLGKIEGRIWETGTAASFCDNYDKILSGTLHDDSLFAFLKKQSEKYKLPTPKGTRDQFVKNVDDRILRTVFDGVRSNQITGNEGMHQRRLAAAAVALNTQPDTTQWLDWLFAPNGGALPGLIVGKLDRDGISPEAGPGYALSWGAGFAQVATLLADYPEYTKHNIFRDFPQFRATFTAAYRLCALGIATPNIGDTGSTGAVGRADLNPNFIATGYRYTHDPALAVAAYRANDNSADGLGRDVFSKDPDALAKDIERLGKAAGPRPVASSLVSGYGLALLESGASPNTGTALSLYYGRSIFHGHGDHLNFDLLAFGHWLAPDHGYPEFATTWPHRQNVTVNTLSHNTVVVDQQPQTRDYGGHTRLFSTSPGLTVIQADAHPCYPQTTQYTRTMLLIDAPSDDSKSSTAQPNSPLRKQGVLPATTETSAHPNTYILDLFQVTGGKDHLYSFHGPPGPVTPTSLSLTPQPEGSYAGANVPFKSTKAPTGYSWWYNVQRNDSPPNQFTLDWQTQPGYRGTTDTENTHLRFHSLTAGLNDVALADADPPQNKPGNPRRLTYALLHHKGADKNLSTTFASVLEPYQGKPFIQSIERLDTPESPGAVAVRITFTNGVIDHLYFNPSPQPLKLPDAASLTGTLALTREQQGKVQRATLIDASDLAYKNIHLQSPQHYTGTVAKMNKNLDGGGWILTATPLPTDHTLVGQTLFVANDNPRDAAYTIRAVTREGDLTKIDCGPISFVRDYAGPTTELRSHPVPKSYDKGYLYDFQEGAPFTIPLTTTLSP